MRIFSCMAVALPLVTAAPVARVPAGRLPPPPAPDASGDSEVRWIPKIPVAPLPDVPTAPLPETPTTRGSRDCGPVLTDARGAAAHAPEVLTAGPASEPTTIGGTDLGVAGQDSTTAEATWSLVPDGSMATPAATTLALAEAERIALQNNPTLVQAAARVRAAEGRCVQAGLYPNPTLGYVGDEIGDEGTLGQQGAFLFERFITAGKLRLRTDVAAQQIVQAQQAWEAQRRRVLNDVRAAWYETLVAQRTVRLHRELVRIGQQGVKAAADLLATMEVSRVDLLQARIEAESAELQLADAKHRYLAAWRRLAALLGAPETQPVRLAGDLDAIPPARTWNEALARLLAKSPERAEAEAGIALARYELARQRAERVPNIDLEAGVRYHHVDQSAIATVEFGLPLPIFNRNQGNIYKAQAQLVAAEKEVQRVELALHERLAAVFQRYVSARQAAEKYAEEILPHAKASLDLVQTGYRRGEYDYLTLLTAQRTYFQANLSYLASLSEIHQSSILMQGLLLTGALRKGEIEEATPDAQR